MELTNENVTNVFDSCLYDASENTDNHFRVDGITKSIDFTPEKLKENEQNIVKMLQRLPDQFQKDGGGGWSFLNTCEDNMGNQWSGDHAQMEKLVLLGIGVGKVKFSMPKEWWSAFPGGMPYLVIDLEAPILC